MIANGKSQDWHMPLALPDIVLTIAADSVQAVGQARRFHYHTRLPTPDENGNIASW